MSDPAVPDASATPAEPPKRALSILFMIVFADLLGFGLIVPLLPFYGKTFLPSDFAVTLLFSVYSLCQLVAAPILGSLSDRKGRRPVLIFSQVGSVAGYLMLGAVSLFTWDPKHLGWAVAMLFASRVIDGISGGNISAAQAYISDVTSPTNRAKAMGMLGAAFGIGFAVGPAVGGILGHFHPSYPAFAAAAFCVLAATLTFLFLPETRVHRPSNATSIFHPKTFSPILKKPVARNVLLIWFFSMAAFVMIEATFALFLNARFGYGSLQVGWFFAYIGLTIAVIQGLLIGKLIGRFGEWALTLVGPLLVTVAMALYFTSNYAPAVGLLIVAGFLNATGRSLQGPTLSSVLSQNVDPREQGVAFGLYHSIGSLARVVGPPIAGFAFERHHAAPFAIAGTITFAVAVWTWVLWVRAREAKRRPVTASS